MRSGWTSIGVSHRLAVLLVLGGPGRRRRRGTAAERIGARRQRRLAGLLERGEPRIGGQRPAHLVEDVRPVVAVVVDGADDLQLAMHRVAFGRQLAAGGEHLGVPRRVAHGAIEVDADFAGPRILRREQDADGRDGEHDRGGGADEPRIADASSRGRANTVATSNRAAPRAGFLAPGRRLISIIMVADPQAAVRSASPTGSISSGATSSVDRNSMAPSRTRELRQRVRQLHRHAQALRRATAAVPGRGPRRRTRTRRGSGRSCARTWRGTWRRAPCRRRFPRRASRRPRRAPSCDRIRAAGLGLFSRRCRARAAGPRGTGACRPSGRASGSARLRRGC